MGKRLGQHQLVKRGVADVVGPATSGLRAGAFQRLTLTRYRH